MYFLDSLYRYSKKLPLFFRFKSHIDELVKAFHSTESKENKLKILTLSPFTIERTMEIFGTTNYLVKKSKKLKNEYGLFPDIPKISKGKVLSEDTKQIVKSFWESDEISRVCPSAKDFLRIRNKDGVKESIQKRLVLMNLREAFATYKSEKNNPLIGFSTFAELRPKNCILAGPSGTHSVCVYLPSEY